jgi:hypothetical protein
MNQIPRYPEARNAARWPAEHRPVHGGDTPIFI